MNIIEAGRQVVLYHKHKMKEQYYHKHRVCRSVPEAIENIKSHDAYVLERKNKFQ